MAGRPSWYLRTSVEPLAIFSHALTLTSADWDREGREKRKGREAAEREDEKRRRGVGASGKPGFSGWKAEKGLAIPVRRPAWPWRATPPGLNRSIAYPGSLPGGFQRPASARRSQKPTRPTATCGRR